MAFAAETICVQGSNERRDPFGAISMPIYQNAAYAHPGLGKSTGYDYSRCGNPTRDEVQKTVALLEQGTEALAFSTGMAAITALMEIFSPGDHLIATDDLYGGTLRLWNTISHKNGISVDCVDTSNVENVKAAIRPETKAIYLETPSNPMMKVADIQAIAELAHAHGCILIVDNTFLSPYFQKPLTLGADIVVHSGTKYLEGHNDTLSGFLVVRDDALYQARECVEDTCRFSPVQLKFFCNIFGNRSGSDDGNRIISRTKIGDAYQSGNTEFRSPLSVYVAGQFADNEIYSSIVTDRLKHSACQ